jgi:predicted metal-dependent phosphoesterase TrpH
MWSGDSTTTEEELVDAVAASGIDVLCITDHHAIDGARRLRDTLPCRVIVGEEVRSTQGEIIGLFLEERVPFGLTPHVTAERIRDQGGIVYIPHPFDPMRRNLVETALISLATERLVDAIEVRNAKTSLESLNRRAASFAEMHDLAAGGGSDAHVPDAIGAAYAEIPDFDGPASFLDALRRGTVLGHHSDPPRHWRPRIVPSVAPDAG